MYRSYYPHRLRDSLSPTCGIFLKTYFNILIIYAKYVFFYIGLLWGPMSKQHTTQRNSTQQHTSLRHNAITTKDHHNKRTSQQNTITTLGHHNTTALQHYAITTLCHYNTTQSRHYAIKKENYITTHFF